MFCYKKIISFSFSFLILFSLSAYAGTTAEELFQKAQEEFPLMEKDVSVKDYAKILEIYGPAAKAGNITAMGLCVAILVREKKWDQIYPYLAPLDTMNTQEIHLSEQDLLIMRKQLRLSSQDFLLGSMYKLLSQLYLIGLGTKQDYVKAQKNLEKTATIPKYTIRHKPDISYFKDPSSVASQKAFWEYTRILPGAEIFLLNRLALGEKGYDIERDLKRFVRYKNTAQELAFYEEHMSDALVAILGYRIAVLMLEFKEFSTENIQKVHDILQVVEGKKPSAKALLQHLPKSLQDKANIDALVQFYSKEKMLSQMPPWLLVHFTHQIDSGVLKKPLPPKFFNPISAEELELMAQYDVVKDKAAHIKALPKNFAHEKYYAYKFHMYQDIAENFPELLESYKKHLDSHAFAYAPLRLYLGQKIYEKSLDTLAEHEKIRLQMQFKEAFKHAAETGFPPAMERYGLALIASKDIAERFHGFEILMQAARMKDTNALLALLHLPNNGADAMEREKALLQEAAKLGSAEAVRRLKAQHNIIVHMETKAFMADLVRNDAIDALCSEAEQLLAQKDNKKALYIGAMTLYYVAKRNVAPETPVGKCVAKAKRVFLEGQNLSQFLNADERDKIHELGSTKQALLAFLEKKPAPATLTHVQATVKTEKKIPVIPQSKKPGIAIVMDESYAVQDRMGLGTFIPDQKPDSCLQVVVQEASPLIAVRLESLGGVVASWKTADVKTSALGALAVFQNNVLVNEGHASFALNVIEPSPLTLCVQDNGALADTETRLRVIFYHQNGDRRYAWVQR